MPEVDRKVVEGRTSSKAVAISATAFFGSLLALGAYTLSNYRAPTEDPPVAVQTVRVMDPTALAEYEAQLAAEAAEAERAEYIASVTGRRTGEVAVEGEDAKFDFGEPMSELVEEEDPVAEAEEAQIPFGQPMMDWFADNFGGWAEESE